MCFMKSGVFFVLIVSFLFASIYFVSAESERLNVSDFSSYYNSEVAGQSRLIDKIFGNERINFYLDQNLFFGVVTSDGKIIEQNMVGITNPTLNVYTEGETIQKMIDGRHTIEDAIASGEIQYRGVGFAKRTKFWMIHFVQSFFINVPKIEKKCIDDDGILNADSALVAGKCTDIDGNVYEDSCAFVDGNINNTMVVDYDCNDAGYCEAKNWWCPFETNPKYECEKGACIRCPGSDSECKPASGTPFTFEEGLSAPPAPEPVKF